MKTMKTMKAILRMTIIGLVILSIAQIASASIIYKTDKYTYQQDEPVKLTLKNYNPYPIDVDVRWPAIYNSAGKCIYGCGAHVLNYDPITIPAWGSYSWVWDQKDDNGSQVEVGYYKSKFADAGMSIGWSNTFRIKEITVKGYTRAGVEAGCTILEGDNGYDYLLMYGGYIPLAGSYVKVTGKIRDNMASVCMEGDKMLEVKSIYRIR